MGFQELRQWVALVKSGSWYGGLAVAAQGLDLGQRFGFETSISCPACASRGLDPWTADRRHGNKYAFAWLGRTIPKAGISIGASVFWAGLNAIQGVDQLYSGSWRINQNGHAVDLRLAALKQWSDHRALTALVVHNRFGTTHDVLYLAPIWDPGTQAFSRRARIEENVERSRTWGLHLEYVHPIRAPGWRLGWIATTNLVSHPRIPNYEIQDIPRDPGHSEAFNVGLGIARTSGGSTLGADVVYEPIWTHTWADSDRPVETARGGTIEPGGKTIENRFRFSNAVFRAGFAQDFPFEGPSGISLRVGLAAHTINYTLVQRDNVQLTDRTLNAGWVEWTPTWGISLRFSAWELHYRGSVTGTEIFRLGGDDVTVTEPSGGGNILAAARGPLNMTGLRVIAHQFSISVPIH